MTTNESKAEAMIGLKRTGLVTILLGLGLLCWAAGVGLNARTLEPSLPGVSVGQALSMGGILAGQVITGARYAARGSSRQRAAGLHAHSACHAAVSCG